MARIGPSVRASNEHLPQFKHTINPMCRVPRARGSTDQASLLSPLGDAAGGLSSKFGLFSIRERMKALGGTFDIESALGCGTTATLVLPLATDGKTSVVS